MNSPRIGALLLFLSLVGPGMTLVEAETFHVTSPEKKTVIRVDTKGTITLSISCNNKEVIGPCLSVTQIADTDMCCLPALFMKENGIRVAFTEADLLDYPGIYLKGTGPGKTVLRSTFPPYPLEEHQKDDRTIRVSKGADYIARTSGTREFPWRVFLIAERDGDLVENDLVYRLGSPGAGTFQMVQWADGVNADRNATDYTKETRSITSADRLAVHLAPGGGWVARIRKSK